MTQASGPVSKKGHPFAQEPGPISGPVSKKGHPFAHSPGPIRPRSAHSRCASNVRAGPGPPVASGQMAHGLCHASVLPRSIYSMLEKKSCNTWLLSKYALKIYIYILRVLFLKSQVLQLLKIYIINIY